MSRWNNGEGWVDRVCDTCGNPFRVRRWILKVYPASHCSALCANRDRKGSDRGRLLKAEVARLYVEENLSLKQIADRHGVSVSTVSHYLKLAGVAGRPGNGNSLRTPEAMRKAIAAHTRGERHHSYRSLPMDAIQADYESGVGTEVLGKRYGVTAVTIARKLRLNGVTLRQPGFSRWRTASDGHLVQSGWELLVDEWLTEHGIAHECQPRLPFGQVGRSHPHADFLALGWYIEVWGVVHNVRYAERRKAKTERYQECGLKLIELYPRHIEREDFAPLHILLS